MIERMLIQKPLTREAKKAVIDQFAPFIQRTAMLFARRGPYVGDLDDWRQEVAIAVLEAAERFDPERGVRFATYLYAGVPGKMGRKLLVEGLIRTPSPAEALVPSRRDDVLRAKTVRFDVAGHASSLPGRDSSVRSVDDREEVEWLLTQLQPTYADLMRRRHDDDKSITEIAREDGVSKQIVHQRLTRGYGLLRAAFLRAGSPARNGGASQCKSDLR